MKNRADESEIVVGLDIGTTKVSAVVGEVDSDGITVLGVGNVPCRGLRKGVVSNIEWTVRSISDAIESAQTMAGVEIRTVYASIGGSHARCVASDGVAAVSGGEVGRVDVERVLEGARAIPVDADRQILHVLPREFTVDNQDGIRDPVGMSGVRLGVKVNLVTAATSCVQNVVRTAERCGLTVADVVLGSFASAEAVWNEHREGTRGRDLDITGLSYALLDAAPRQWPCAQRGGAEGAAEGQAVHEAHEAHEAQQIPSRPRLYTDHRFATADGRARFVAPAWKPPAHQ